MIVRRWINFKRDDADAEADDRDDEDDEGRDDEGDEGDAVHGAAMKELSLADFGCSHVQDRTLRRGVRGEVGTIRWCDAPPVKVRVCTVRGEVREERCERRGWRYSVVKNDRCPPREGEGGHHVAVNSSVREMCIS